MSVDQQAAISNYLQSPTRSNFQQINPTFQEGPLLINADSSDVDVVHANLVEVIGEVSSRDTLVTVNYLPAMVNDNGSYYAFVDLMEGYNTIVVTARQNKNIQIKSMTVYFEPPLTVNLDMPEYQFDIDYRKTPLIMTGKVNDPSAQVYVEGKAVAVSPSGNFSADILVSNFSVLAQSKNQIDTESLPLLLIENGHIAPSLGVSINPLSLGPPEEIKLKAGENTIVNWTLPIRKELLGVPSIKIDIGLVGNSYIERITLPIPHGFKITPIPSNFALYPNTNYHIGIYIETDTDLPPGTYDFYLKLSAGSDLSSANLKVTVE
jgi:hypothetical protein